VVGPDCKASDQNKKARWDPYVRKWVPQVSQSHQWYLFLIKSALLLNSHKLTLGLCIRMHTTQNKSQQKERRQNYISCWATVISPNKKHQSVSYAAIHVGKKVSLAVASSRAQTSI
jgi:hypothetical protein